MYFSLLLTFAAIAVALTGSIGVVFALGRRAQGNLSQRERATVFHLLFAAFSTLFFSLLVAALLAGFPASEPAVWRVGNGLAAVVHLFGGSKGVHDATRPAYGDVNGIALATGCIGVFAGIMNAVVLFGYFPALSATVFMLATLWALVVTALAFTFLLATGGDLP